MKSTQCLNCNAALQPEFLFCPACGQKASLHRLSMHDISHEMIHYFTHADKGFFQLIRALFLKTGTVGREYIGGKRKKYFPALNFYLLVAAIYVLLINFTTAHVSPTSSKEQAKVSRITDPAVRESARKIYQRRDKAVGFMNKYSNFVAMAALPIIAFIFWVFYKKAAYNYTEHLVSGMYMVGFTNLLYVVLIVPVSIWLNERNSYFTLFFLFTFKLSYYSVYYYYFMDRRTTASLFKAIGVSAFVAIFWIGLTTFLVGIYIRTGFWGLIR